MRNERINFILMTRFYFYYSDVGSTFNWSCGVEILLRQSDQKRYRDLRNEGERHQHGISALVSQMLFRGEPVVGVVKSPLFSQANFARKARIPRETHKH